MDSTTRNILIGAGVIALGGIGYLVYQGRKDKGKGGVKLFKPKGKEFNMGYIQNAYIHIAGQDRAEASPYMKVGQKVIIEGGNKDMNGERTIAKIWKDANGNVGAFKTKEFSVGYNSSKNRDYENKAKIIVPE